MTYNTTPCVQTCKISVDKSGNGWVKIPEEFLSIGELDIKEFVFFERRFSSMIVTPTKYYTIH